MEGYGETENFLQFIKVKKGELRENEERDRIIDKMVPAVFKGKGKLRKLAEMMHSISTLES